MVFEIEIRLRCITGIDETGFYICTHGFMMEWILRSLRNMEIWMILVLHRDDGWFSTVMGWNGVVKIACHCSSLAGDEKDMMFC